MNDGAPDAEHFLACVRRLIEVAPGLTPIQAGLVAAAALGIAHDSRTYAHRLGLSHALVLRELTALAEDGALLRIEKRDERTMRTHFGLCADAARYTALFLPGEAA
jgi:hypothetical protein